MQQIRYVNCYALNKNVFSLFQFVSSDMSSVRSSAGRLMSKWNRSTVATFDLDRHYLLLFQILERCMAVLQEIPGSQRRSASITESLFHMIACCSYHLAKVRFSWICTLSSCWAGAPLFPLVHLLPHLFPLFYFSLSFIGFTYQVNQKKIPPPTTFVDITAMNCHRIYGCWQTDFLTPHCTVVLQQQCDKATLIRLIYTYIHDDCRHGVKLNYFM